MGSLIWYEEQDAGVEPAELWDLLLRHGFVEGDFRHADAELRRRVEEMGTDLWREFVRSEVAARNYRETG